RPGCEQRACPGSHRGRCSYRDETVVGAPAPGANMCWLRFAPRAVLLQEPAAVGVPAPGAKMCWPGANGVARVRYSPEELALVLPRHSRARPGLRKNVQWRYFPGGARLPGVPR